MGPKASRFFQVLRAKNPGGAKILCYKGSEEFLLNASGYHKKDQGNNMYDQETTEIDDDQITCIVVGKCKSGSMAETDFEVATNKLLAS